MLSSMTNSTTQHTNPTDTEGSDVTQTYAAVDLGSNSFHMIVAKEMNGQLNVVDRLRDMVRLSAGLDNAKCLSLEAQTRALDCLKRFGQRVQNLPQGNVRAVGTNTLRSARNSHTFIQQAENALGHPIEIISGMEEARLIYLGVAHSVAVDENKRLVIDIGGGSTEVIIGEGFAPMCMESLYMGCVSMTMRFFADGKISNQNLRRAEIAARVELEPISHLFRQVGWSRAIGASGTIRAVRSVVQANGWCEEGITHAAMKKLMSAIKAVDHIDKLKLKGLSVDRRPIFVGGFTVLYGLFKALKIENMEVSDGALREGLLHDLLGRLHHEDVRGRSVMTLSKRFQVDLAQAARVEDTAKHILAQVAPQWNLDPYEDGLWLSWAAQLHELGLNIAHSHYHKHGAYIVQNADLPGFSQQEKAVLAAMIRSHRRKFVTALFKDLPERWMLRARRLAIIVRLAVLLHRSRDSEPLPAFDVQLDKDAIRLDFPKGWLDKRSLSKADLEQESNYLSADGITFSYS
jgi:exopolyphosphatase/guanosine-5'-triphosphate,3'-diphosphate pyrophosphatase